MCKLTNPHLHSQKYTKKKMRKNFASLYYIVLYTEFLAKPTINVNNKFGSFYETKKTIIFGKLQFARRYSVEKE